MGITTGPTDTTPIVAATLAAAVFAKTTPEPDMQAQVLALYRAMLEKVRTGHG